jgi:RNA recognition motif-containing protein
METIKRAADRLLNRMGYYNSNMPAGSVVSEKEVLEMFKTYGENEMFVRLLRDLCANDIRVYFQASNDEDRRTIRGAYQRTNYFISLIRKANDKRKRN